MARRLHQTIADYIVIAISPALIMALVGSLVFFLITVFYQGQWPERLLWVMACFVFAAVLIGRISIEEGFERAAPFGIALAIVVGIAANRFMEFQGGWIDNFAWLINWGLIALVWWCTHRLTWDCTMIDDSQDASGEGLLQVAGLERPDDRRNLESGATAQGLDGTTSRQVPAGWWQRYVEHQRRPHAPGVWVVYFSLAALPLFGIGQWFIPVSSTAARRSAFWFLCVYVASGLALLLTTSFLGLRRYLRQRRIEMPTAMANLWLGTGAVVIVVLLAVAALLPRPSAEYAISQLPISFGSPNAKSNRVAPIPRDGTKDEQPGTAPSPQPDDKQPGEGESDQSQAAEQQQSSSAADGQSGGRKSGERGKSEQSGKQAGGKSKEESKQEPQSDAENRKSDRQNDLSSKIDGMRKAAPRKSKQPQNGKQDQQPAEKPDERDEQEQPPPDEQRQDGAEREQSADAAPLETPQALEAPLGFVAQLLQWAFYAVFILGVLYFLWRFRAEVLAAIRDFVAAIRDLWNGMWGRKRPRGLTADEPVEIKLPPAPFSTYADPFATGVAGRYSLEELVRYSFDAFEAWSREHGCPREPEVTPHELARDVAKLNTHIAADARNLAELYARAAYARGELPDNAREQLRHLWQSMRATRVTPQ